MEEKNLTEKTAASTDENKTLMEVFDEIRDNYIPYIPEEGREAFMTAVKFFILAS